MIRRESLAHLRFRRGRKIRGDHEKDAIRSFESDANALGSSTSAIAISLRGFSIARLFRIPNDRADFLALRQQVLGDGAPTLPVMPMIAYT